MGGGSLPTPQRLQTGAHLTQTQGAPFGLLGSRAGDVEAAVRFLPGGGKKHYCRSFAFFWIAASTCTDFGFSQPNTVFHALHSDDRPETIANILSISFKLQHISLNIYLRFT